MTDDVFVSRIDSGAKDTEGVSILAGITVLGDEKEFIRRTFESGQPACQFLTLILINQAKESYIMARVAGCFKKELVE